MKILLPPSEGKSTPKKLRNLDLKKLAYANELLELRKNILNLHPEIDQKRCDYAFNVYNGVLFQALDFCSLNQTSKKRAEKSILIFSAAYGLLSLTDLISAYKFKPNAKYWRSEIQNSLANLTDELIVDCRSSTYQSMWQPNPEMTVGIRVFALVAGKKKVITHMSKKTRGEVVNFLVAQRSSPKTPIELFRLLKQEFNCSLISASAKESWFIDVLAN